MNKNIVVIEGDGIGPEVTRQSIKVLNALAEKFHHEFEYKYCLMGADAIDKTGNPLPDETIEACLNSDAILFGAIGHPKYDNDPTAKVRPEQGLLKLRRSLQLFANIRPVNTYPSLHHLSPLKNKNLEGVDFIIFRELTGGIYFGKKELSEDGMSAIDECIYTKAEIERVAHLAFHFAQKPERRKKLMLVDKANVLETSRLWRKTAYPAAAGKDIANPIGSILSMAMMLEYLGMPKEAGLVREAVNWTLTNSFVTKDLDPVNFYFTSTIGELITDYVNGKIPASVKKENIELRKSTII